MKRPNCIALRWLRENDDAEALEKEVQGWYDWYVWNVQDELYRHYGWSADLDDQFDKLISKLDEVIETYSPTVPTTNH